MPNYRIRLQGEMAELDDALSEMGRTDGITYAKNAPYRELLLIGKLIDGYSDPNQGDLNPMTLSCQACDVDEPDADSREWIETNLAKRWQDEEPYLRGFVYGALEILEELE